MIRQNETETGAILIVEDEALIAMQLEDMLDSESFGPAVVAGSVGVAMAEIKGRKLRAALIDISLGGEPIWPVADRLAENAIPFIFCSGGFADVPLRHSHVPRLTKPYGLAQLSAALAGIGISND